MPALRLRLHDTLTGKLTPLVPKRPGEVRIYTCGPTTYDVAHIGHARAALAPDILVRHLRAQGLQVTYVRNITDVDDKILKRAGEQGIAPTELSAKMALLYQEDVGRIGCVEPDVQPKVSEHIPEIIALIQTLIARGTAYEVKMPSGAHDVYYAVRAFPSYGKLSKRNIDDMCVGARVEANEEKRDPLDFALWKGVSGEGWGWDSPWGKGRPGWHIECSAMAERYLGHGFDVHCGGMDLIFPHHENEIAQSEAAHPDAGPFVELWIHNGFVNIDKEKMAKSLGNFVTMRDVLARNDAEALRYFLLTVHHRGPIQFDTEKLADGRVIFPGVVEAERRVDYLYQAVTRLMSIGVPSPGGTAPAKMPKDLVPFTKIATDARSRVDAALDEDLNTPVALAVLAEVAKAANELADLVQRRRKDAELTRLAPFVAAQLLIALRLAAEPLGLLPVSPEAYRERTQKQRLELLGMTAAQIDARLAERTAARAAKDFARADAIRKEMDALGIEVADSPEGTTWRVGPIGAAAIAALA
ncbi:Cysteinyl-tRNA synthetase [Minicystis rosea]|nr:Cysteinyl-tRNA synthetase [Minicystis rosea]